MKRWFSRKLWVAIGGTIVLFAGSKMGAIEPSEALEQARLLWVAYIAAQGAVDVTANFKKEPKKEDLQ